MSGEDCNDGYHCGVARDNRRNRHQHLVEELGGLSAVLGAATGAERAQVYASLGLRLDYDPYLRRVQATVDLSRVAGCVRGGT